VKRLERGLELIIVATMFSAGESDVILAVPTLVDPSLVANCSSSDECPLHPWSTLLSPLRFRPG